MMINVIPSWPNQTKQNQTAMQKQTNASMLLENLDKNKLPQWMQKYIDSARCLLEDSWFQERTKNVLKAYKKRGKRLPPLDIVLWNAVLDDETRISKIREYLHSNHWIAIDSEQETALLQAHKVWWEKGNKIFSYSKKELIEKRVILLNAWFTKSVIQELMDYGFVGKIPWQVDDATKKQNQLLVTLLFFLPLPLLRMYTPEWSIRNDNVADMVQVWWMWWIVVQQILWTIYSLLKKRQLYMSNAVLASFSTALWLLTEMAQKMNMLSWTYDPKDVLAFVAWWLLYYMSLQRIAWKDT